MSLPKRPFHFPGLSATVQLFLFVVLPLTLLLLAVTFGSLSLHHQAMRSLVGERDLRAVRAAAASLGKDIAHQGAMLQALADTLPAQAGPQALQALPERQTEGFSAGLALYGPSGGQVAAVGDPAAWGIQDLAGLLAAAKPGPAYALSEPAPAASGPLLIAAAAGPSGQVLVGVAPVQALLAGDLRDLGAGEHLSAWVVAPGEGALYQTGRLAAAGAQSGMASALAGESGIDYIHAAGGEHVVAFSPINPSGWGLVVEEAWEASASPLLTTTQTAPLVLVPLLILVLGGLWFGLRQIVQPLQRLENQAADLARGDFAAIRQPVGGVGEIRSLQARLASMAERLSDAQASLHSYIGALTAGVEAERHSLARELHDDTLQALIALNQRLQLAASQNASGLPGILTETQAIAGQAIVNLRRVVRGLRPIYLEDLGLAASLEMLARESGQTSGCPVAFTLTGEPARLAPPVELALYRIAQEALSNVTRHAQADRAWVELAIGPDQVRLVIADNGRGFTLPDEPGDFARRGHYGLLGMRERAELAGASLQIVSQPGRGTRVEVQLPRRAAVAG